MKQLTENEKLKIKTLSEKREILIEKRKEIVKNLIIPIDTEIERIRLRIDNIEFD